MIGNLEATLNSRIDELQGCLEEMFEYGNEGVAVDMNDVEDDEISSMNEDNEMINDNINMNNNMDNEVINNYGYDELSEDEAWDSVMHTPTWRWHKGGRMCQRIECEGRVNIWCARCNVPMCIRSGGKTAKKLQNGNVIANCWYYFHSNKDNRKGYTPSVPPQNHGGNNNEV